MYRGHGSCLTAKGSAYAGRWLRTMLQGLSLLCVALSVVSCVQRADLIKLETELKSEISNLAEARARFKNELRTLREEHLPQLHGEMETTVRRMDQLREALVEESDRLNQHFNQRVDDVAQQVVERTNQLQQGDAALEARLIMLDTNMMQVLGQRDTTVKDQFVSFRDSLVQFKETLGQVDTQLAEERNRATDAERAMQHAFTRHQDALRKKLDSDTQALKTYLTTDVHKTIRAINRALDTNAHVLNDKLNAHGMQLSEVTAGLHKLRQALQGYVERMNQVAGVVEQLRNDVQSMRAGLAFGGDDHESRRIELPTVPESSR